ncbi:hypothetical protein GC170_17385 [bacterium]|nr:hypothetical protein [bacterium]
MTIRRIVIAAGLLIFLPYGWAHFAFGQAEAQARPETGQASFESPLYGIRTSLPALWPILTREKDEMVFVCQIPQPEMPERPGVFACEIAIAPEKLEEYRTRIEKNAQRGNSRGELVVNEIHPAVPDGLPERLETIREFRLPDGETWRELSFLIIRGRHMYTFILNVEVSTMKKVRPSFEKAVAATVYSTPDSGADRITGAPTNRWIQSEYQFVVDLPQGWAALLAPREVAILYANAPPKGIWADNMLILAAKKGSSDYARLAETLPADLEAVDPSCKVRFSRVVRTKNDREALETVVDVKRGPFAMTIHEWRFRGDRYDYELKFTVETSGYDALKPDMIKCFESFAELPADGAEEKPSRNAPKP